MPQASLNVTKGSRAGGAVLRTASPPWPRAQSAGNPKRLEVERSGRVGLGLHRGRRASRRQEVPAFCKARIAKTACSCRARPANTYRPCSLFTGKIGRGRAAGAGAGPPRCRHRGPRTPMAGKSTKKPSMPAVKESGGSPRPRSPCAAGRVAALQIVGKEGIFGAKRPHVDLEIRRMRRAYAFGACQGLGDADAVGVRRDLRRDRPARAPAAAPGAGGSCRAVAASSWDRRTG